MTDLAPTLRLATREDAEVLQELYAAHLLVLAEHNPTVDPTNRLQDDWFEKPGVLYAWCIQRDSDVAGFVLAGTRKLSAAMHAPTMNYCYEFYVHPDHRRRGLGRAAVDAMLTALAGSWCVDVLPANERAIAFWAATLGSEGVERAAYVDPEGVTFERFVVER